MTELALQSPECLLVSLVSDKSRVWSKFVLAREVIAVSTTPHWPIMA